MVVGVVVSAVLVLALVGVFLIGSRGSAAWMFCGPLVASGSLYGFSGIDLEGAELVQLALIGAFVWRIPRIPSSFWLAAIPYSAVVLVALIRSPLDGALLSKSALDALTPVLVAGVAITASRWQSGRWFLRGIVLMQVIMLVELVSIYISRDIPWTGDLGFKQFIVIGVGGSNYAAAIACLGVAIAIAWPHGEYVPERVAVAVLGLPIVGLAMSRWSLVVLGLVVLTWLLLNIRRWALLLAAAAVFAGVIFAEGSKSMLFASVSSIAEGGRNLSSYSSGETRLAIWQAYREAFLEEPVLGLGLGWSDTSVVGFPILAHNLFLQLLSSGGLALLVSYLGFVIWLSLRMLRQSGSSTIVLLVGGWVASLLEPAMWTSRYDIIFFAAMGLMASGFVPSSGSAGAKERGSQTVAAVLPTEPDYV